jgi:hypothetical protein
VGDGAEGRGGGVDIVEKVDIVEEVGGAFAAAVSSSDGREHQEINAFRDIREDEPESCRSLAMARRKLRSFVKPNLSAR